MNTAQSAQVSMLSKVLSLQGYIQVAIAVVVSALILAGLFSETVIGMVEVWNSSETYSHCFFIFPILLYLLHAKRHQFNEVLQPDWRFIWLAIPPVLLWLIGAVAQINIFMHAGWVGMLLASVFVLLGWPLLKQSFLTVIFLVFAVPFGDEIVPALVNITADFTVTTLRFLNFPVFREGNHFSLPSGNWSVVEACSGVRYLMASVTIGYVYALLSYQSLKKRAIFILVSAIVPIIANGLRAVIIVLIGHYSGMKLATGVDHLIYGWLFFGVVIFILFWIGRYWQDPEPEPIDIKPTDSQATLSVAHSGGAIIGLIILLGLFSVWEKGVSYYPGHTKPLFAENSQTSPNIDSGSQWQPDYLKPDLLEIQPVSLSADQSETQVWVYHYGVQEGGNELASNQNQLVKPSNKQALVLAKDQISVQVNGQSVSYQRSKIKSDQGFYSVAYASFVGKQPIAGSLGIKIQEAKNRLYRTPQVGRAVFFIKSFQDQEDIQLFSQEEITELTQNILERL